MIVFPFHFILRDLFAFQIPKKQRKTKDITIRKSTQKFTSLRPSPCTVCILPSRRLDEEVMAAGTDNSSWFISSVLSRTSALLLAEFVLRLFSATTDAPKWFFCCYVNRFTSLFAKVLTFSMGFVSLALISIVPSVLWGPLMYIICKGRKQQGIVSEIWLNVL